MAAFANSFKAEVARIVRKEGKDDIASLRQTAAAHRAEISALKKEVRGLAAEVKALAKALARTQRSVATPEEPAPARGGRQFTFRAEALTSKRERLGLSVAQMAELVEASPLSIRRWEAGSASPRAAQLERIRTVLSMGVREARSRLAARKSEES